MKNILPIFLSVAAALFANGASAQSFYIEEDPIYIRFEQYTGSTGGIAFWRLPTPGTSLFPGGNCKALILPSAKPEDSSRFMALYLFAKTTNKKIFYYYGTSNCTIVSFGING